MLPTPHHPFHCACHQPFTAGATIPTTICPSPAFPRRPRPQTPAAAVRCESHMATASLLHALFFLPQAPHKRGLPWRHTRLCNVRCGNALPPLNVTPPHPFLFALPGCTKLKSPSSGMPLESVNISLAPTPHQPSRLAAPCGCCAPSHPTLPHYLRRPRPSPARYCSFFPRQLCACHVFPPKTQLCRGRRLLRLARRVGGWPTPTRLPRASSSPSLCAFRVLPCEARWPLRLAAQMHPDGPVPPPCLNHRGTALSGMLTPLPSMFFSPRFDTIYIHD